IFLRFCIQAEELRKQNFPCNIISAKNDYKWLVVIALCTYEEHVQETCHGMSLHFVIIGIKQVF
ncbi:hypothetical protein CI594_21865, partial [Fischerella thermalis CCMEE 5196]